MSSAFYHKLKLGKLGGEMATELFIAFNVTFGKLVRLERVRRGWRQADLAEKAGVTQAEVSALERGLYVAPASAPSYLAGA